MKTILITGASGGIGSEIASTFANSNNRLILVYHSNLKEIKALKQKLFHKCELYVYKCNLADDAQLKAMIDDVIAKYKKIDILINCAGISLFKQIQDVTDEDYHAVVDANLKSTVMTTSYVAKHMISEKYGKIINISSMWGVVGSSMESVYSASKGAINAFTLSLAKELGPSNITVNAICPGLIDTKMNKSLTEETIKSIVEDTPMQRIGTPSDVANLVKFLCNDKSNFITGQIIMVDGGYTL